MKSGNSITRKMLAGGLSAALMLSSVLYTAPLSLAADAGKGNSSENGEWRKTISIDFGIKNEINGISSRIPEAQKKQKDDGSIETIPAQLIPRASGYEEYADIVGDIIKGDGTMLYEDTTVQELYNENEDMEIKQKIGFDRVLPSAITSGGEYFNDWVFSPDGEAYKFSADLIPGQYYVCIYTGNKLKEQNNTTFVNFNDEKAGDTTIFYDQTSPAQKQFYGPQGDNDNKYIYSVDVQDNGKGYGTLVVNLSDTKISDPAYEGSHTFKVVDALNKIEEYNNLTDEEKSKPENSEKAKPRIKAVDFYEGEDNEIDSASIADKLITARLNGIEIVPVRQTKHITPEAYKLPKELKNEVGGRSELLIKNLADFTDRIVFSSSDTNVASVNVYTGEVTPVGEGTAKISAYSGYWDSVISTNYTVTPETVVNLDKSSVKLVLDSGDDDKTTLTASFNVADEDVIEWSVDNPDVIQLGDDIFAKGEKDSTCRLNIKALKAGTATITARRKDTEKTAACTVNVVKPVKSFELTKEDGTVIAEDSTINLYKDDTLTIRTKVTPDDATDKSVDYVSSNRQIASVSKKGDGIIISAKAAGEATITCTAVSNPKASVKFKVAVSEKPDNKPADNNAGNNADNNPAGNAAAASPTPASATASSNVAAVTATGKDESVSSNVTIKLSGKSKQIIKLKKSVSIKASVSGSSIAKITYRIKSGKKLIKVKVIKNKLVKITARKKGSAKINIIIKAKDGTTRTFTRTITVKK